MGQFELISAGVTIYLITSGILLQLSGKYISASKHHQLAFVAIFILILAIFPQLGLSQVAPGIIFHLGMMLFALHLSAYYSGTPIISAHMYALIIYLAAAVLAPLSHTIFNEWSVARSLLMGGTWLLVMELERTVSGKSYQLSTVEKNLLWVWFLSAIMGLWEHQIQMLPDLFFLVILIVHLEKRWPKLHVPAPLVALYGLLVVWYAHFTLSGIPGSLGEISGHGIRSSATLGIVLVIMAGFLLYGFRSRSVSKQFLYLFLAQETILLGLGIDNLFLPSQELIGLQRVLLFVCLMGLFVMIESTENAALDKVTIRGLFWERPRFTSSVILVSLFFAIYPAFYVNQESALSLAMILGVVIISGLWTANLFRNIFMRIEREYRILRPSLSIWSTVVFTILWAAVVGLEILSRDFFQ